ncbi:MAG: MFS transporter [Candidatus Bathyarchaeota archaeon]|nr:MFS transporter [Candidatus Bathyarchaeota archaeon]
MTLFLATQTTQPILPLYITEKGATTFELGVIISLLSFTTIAAKIPLGVLAERIGRWPILPAVTIGQTASLLLYSIVPDATWFYPIRIFHAVSLAAFAPTALAIAQDLAPPSKRGTTMGAFLTSFGVATTFGPFLCTFLINYVDYPQLFQIASIIPLIGLAPLLLIKRDKDLSSISHKKPSLNLLGSLKALTSSRNMLILAYLRLTFSFTNAFFLTLFAIHAENILPLPQSVIASLVAFLFGIKGITNMLSRIPSGKLTDKAGYKLPIIIAFTLLTITFLTISETSNIQLLAVAMIIYGIAHGMRAVTEWSMLGDYAPLAGNIATAYLSTMFNIGGAFGAVAAGALSTILNIQTIFKLASIIILSGAFAINLVKRS